MKKTLSIIIPIIIIIGIATPFVIKYTNENKEYKQLQKQVEIFNSLSDEADSYDKEIKKMNSSHKSGYSYYTNLLTKDEINEIVSLEEKDNPDFNPSVTPSVKDKYSNIVDKNKYGEDLYAECTLDEYNQYNDTKKKYSDKQDEISTYLLDLQNAVADYNNTHKKQYQIELSGIHIYLKAI